MVSHLKKSCELFIIQFTYYMVLTINYRAISSLNYIATFVTDIIIAALAFTSIQRVAKAENLGDRIAYIFGGAIGAITALKLSTFLF